MLGLFLLGMMSRAKNAAAAAGVTCGVLVIAWMALSPSALWPAAWKEFASPFSDLLPIVFGTLAVFGVGVAVAAVCRLVTGIRD
jgi:SSS family solute:Na+ symporter